MRKCAVTITIVHGRVVVNTPVALPDGTYKAVLVLNDAADQSLVVQDTPPGVHAQRTREPRDSAVLERRLQSVGKTNFVLLCAALLGGVRDDQALMRLLPDTNADTSKRSIISTARRLVEDGSTEDVLAMCLDSNLPTTVLAEAQRLFRMVRGSVKP